MAARLTATTVAAISAGMLAVALVFGWLTRSVSSGGSWSGGGLVGAAAIYVSMLGFTVVGALIARRHPRNAIGWLLLAIGLAWSLTALTTYSDYGLKLHPGSVVGAQYVAAIGSAQWVPAVGLAGTFLILLFPDGHLPSPRWRWVAWMAATGIAVGMLSLMLTPGRLGDAGYPHTDNPVGVSGIARELDVLQLSILLIPLSMVVVAAGLVARFRRSRGLERLQLKWLVCAAAVVAVTYAFVTPVSALVAPGSDDPPTWLAALQVVALASFALIPVAIGIAVLRHNLYEIDRIIRRTTLYVCVAVTLGSLYFGGIWLSSLLLQRLIGHSGAIAVTISTLVVAAAFQPVRRWLQRAIDRRFYRARYDAQATVDGFSRVLRRQVDLDSARTALLGAVDDAVRPTHASVWLRDGMAGTAEP
jgi:hypothetical protein